jgi:hypothetical protein
MKLITSLYLVLILRYKEYIPLHQRRAGIAQSVTRRATGWIAGVRFPIGESSFFLLHSVQTGSEAHPASYPMGSEGSFPGVLKLSTHIHLEPWSRMAELYLHFPIRLHGVALCRLTFTYHFIIPGNFIVRSCGLGRIIRGIERGTNGIALRYRDCFLCN